MTILEFIDRLKATATNHNGEKTYTLRLTPDIINEHGFYDHIRSIRATRSGMCPLCEVDAHKTGKAIPSWQFRIAGYHLGLSWLDARDIMDAADGARGHDVCVRYMLLKACGLEEMAT